MFNNQLMFNKKLHLQINNISIISMDISHESGLAEACKDGELWNLNVTNIPHYLSVRNYIENAIIQKKKGQRIPFVVIDQSKNTVIGTTSFHDILLDCNRLEIGFTWYAKRYQRTHINTSCKFLLLQYAFEELNASTVGFRTDNLNMVSQRAIERLGAKKDGAIRGNALRKDMSIKDTVMYSITREEWDTEAKKNLMWLINKY